MILEEARRRVARGVVWLDEHEPGWRDVVDVERLKMRNGNVGHLKARNGELCGVVLCGCLGAQLDAINNRALGSYCRWRIKRGLSMDEASSLGFDVDFPKISEVSYSDLDQAWQEELRKGESDETDT